LREKYNDLDRQKQATLAALAEIDAAEAADPVRATTDAAELLDGLPYLALNLAHAPEELLTKLFEVTQLTVQLHADSDDATVSITLPDDYLHEVSATAERISDA